MCQPIEPNYDWKRVGIAFNASAEDAKALERDIRRRERQMERDIKTRLFGD